MINLPVNKKLIEIRYKSYYQKRILIRDVISLYLKFDNDLWYSVIICDGKSTFELVQEPLLSNEIANDDEFYYPIRIFNKVDLKQFGKLLIIEEYLWGGLDDESCGFNLKFDNGTNINITEKDDCLFVNTNENDNLINNCLKKTL